MRPCSRSRRCSAVAAGARAVGGAGAARSDATRTRPQATNGLLEHLGLTLREAEVLLLVARGLTNREIAAELVISAKTASVHVSHILRKLDAPNRLEAAAITHRLRIPSNTAHLAAKHGAKPG